MIYYIKNLKELKNITCLECDMKANNISCCTDPIEPRLCCYIESLNFAIKLMEALEEIRK